MSDTPLVEAHGLTKAYGELIAVDSIDLEVSPGEVFGLLGPNGAGKTTTVLMLLGLSEPTAGTVRVCGHDPARDPLAVSRPARAEEHVVVFVFDPAGGGVGGAVGVDAGLGEVDGVEADLLGEASARRFDHGLAGGGVAAGGVGPAQREARLDRGALLEQHPSA